MRLSVRSLINFVSVNSFCTANQHIIRAGEKNTLYFQLVDLDQASACCNSGCGSRYIPGLGVGNTPVSLIVTFPSIDCTKTIQATAVQDPNDASIWSVTLSSSQIPQGGALNFAITQGTTLRNFSVFNILGVEYPGHQGSDISLANIGIYNNH